eukprot:m.142674 g.142674  ORF g.142674 m.142674 type:complete len:389 (+) comp16718_c1_seq1:1605-2771(+)
MWSQWPALLLLLLLVFLLLLVRGGWVAHPGDGAVGGGGGGGDAGGHLREGIVLLEHGAVVEEAAGVRAGAADEDELDVGVGAELLDELLLAERVDAAAVDLDNLVAAVDQAAGRAVGRDAQNIDRGQGGALAQKVAAGLLAARLKLNAEGLAVCPVQLHGAAGAGAAGEHAGVDGELGAVVQPAPVAVVVRARVQAVVTVVTVAGVAVAGVTVAAVAVVVVVADERGSQNDEGDRLSTKFLHQTLHGDGGGGLAVDSEDLVAGQDLLHGGNAARGHLADSDLAVAVPVDREPELAVDALEDDLAGQVKGGGLAGDLEAALLAASAAEEALQEGVVLVVLLLLLLIGSALDRGGIGRRERRGGLQRSLVWLILAPELDGHDGRHAAAAR